MKYIKPSIEEIKLLDSYKILTISESPIIDDPDPWDSGEDREGEIHQDWDEE